MSVTSKLYTQLLFPLTLPTCIITTTNLTNNKIGTSGPSYWPLCFTGDTRFAGTQR
jgi:hypothetical protein